MFYNLSFFITRFTTYNMCFFKLYIAFNNILFKYGSIVIKGLPSSLLKIVHKKDLHLNINQLSIYDRNPLKLGKKTRNFRHF
jgi:hypothetical protein